jgi:hypothetical protein
LIKTWLGVRELTGVGDDSFSATRLGRSTWRLWSSGDNGKEEKDLSIF